MLARRKASRGHPAPTSCKLAACAPGTPDLGQVKGFREIAGAQIADTEPYARSGPHPVFSHLPLRGADPDPPCCISPRGSPRPDPLSPREEAGWDAEGGPPGRLQSHPSPHAQVAPRSWGKCQPALVGWTLLPGRLGIAWSCWSTSSCQGSCSQGRVPDQDPGWCAFPVAPPPLLPVASHVLFPLQTKPDQPSPTGVNRARHLPRSGPPDLGSEPLFIVGSALHTGGCAEHPCSP